MAKKSFNPTGPIQLVYSMPILLSFSRSTKLNKNKEFEEKRSVSENRLSTETSQPVRTSDLLQVEKLLVELIEAARTVAPSTKHHILNEIATAVPADPFVNEDVEGD